MKLFLVILFLFYSQVVRAEEISNEMVISDTNIFSSIYQREYSLTENIIDWKLMKTDNYVMLGASVVVLGILYLLPESFTNWDKDDAKFDTLFTKWWDNVREGPVIDEDDFFLNYIAHPYCGAVYYMAARSAGANVFYSFLYSVVLSTFFWEYGIEAFAEVPSTQDLIVTPVVGSLFGEGFYLAKRHILKNEGRLFNSTILGTTAMFLMDPITEFSNLFLGRNHDGTDKNLTVVSFPTMSSDGDFGYNIAFNLRF